MCEQAGVATLGALSVGVPTPSFPAGSLWRLPSLLPVSVSITLVGFIESIAIGKTIGAKAGYEVDADAELLAPAGGDAARRVEEAGVRCRVRACDVRVLDIAGYETINTSMCCEGSAYTCI